ncbi:hypothetical protein mRhiFer1_009254 [Rhinolophus ferrumequinum]|uniref:Uncharacterized protein n=1 Tax=Rhinolophus ferrumequinum TaxID=59479 RepID=A0A7J7S7Z5_RHIFE|nr:hypothetical protein mRhiFer1_009254 [Rhinolophus ferrumequinum]
MLPGNCIPQRCRKGRSKASGPLPLGWHLSWCHSNTGLLIPQTLPEHPLGPTLWMPRCFCLKSGVIKAPGRRLHQPLLRASLSFPICTRGLPYIACLRHSTPTFHKAPVYLLIFVLPLKNGAFANQTCLPLRVGLGR